MVRQSSVLAVGTLLCLLHSHEAFHHGAFLAPGAVTFKPATICRQALRLSVPSSTSFYTFVD
jgi:hypothetical protein